MNNNNSSILVLYPSHAIKNIYRERDYSRYMLTVYYQAYINNWIKHDILSYVINIRNDDRRGTRPRNYMIYEQ